MIRYKVVSQVTLNIMGRKKTFQKDEEVTEDSYTTTFPKHFQRIGEEKGYINFLSVPIFIPDTIQEFIQKEEGRTLETKDTVKDIQVQKLKEVEIDEIAEVIDEFSIDLDIAEIIEDKFNEDDVTIETEEN